MDRIIEYFSCNSSANKRKAKIRKRFYSTTSSISEKLGLPQLFQDHCVPQNILPCLGLCIGTCVGIFMTIFSDSFVLLRDCRGNCIDPMKKFDEWKAALGAFICSI